MPNLMRLAKNCLNWQPCCCSALIENDEVYAVVTMQQSRAADKTSASLQTIYVTTQLAGCPTRVFAFSQRTNE